MYIIRDCEDKTFPIVVTVGNQNFEMNSLINHLNRLNYKVDVLVDEYVIDHEHRWFIIRYDNEQNEYNINNIVRINNPSKKIIEYQNDYLINGKLI